MTYDYIKSFPKCHAGDAITVSYNVPCDIALITERDYQLTVNRDDDSFLLRVSADEIEFTIKTPLSISRESRFSAFPFSGR